MHIIGLVGHPSSGKDTAAEYLVKQGFFHISCGDVLRAEMKKLDLPIDRPSIRKFATEQRKKIGAYYPVNMIISTITEKTVISGFRNLAEVSYLKDQFKTKFYLIAIEAPLESRYQRALSRNRTGDNISFEDFKAHEEAERNQNPESHELDNVIAQADYLIENDGSVEDLYKEMERVLTKI